MALVKCKECGTQISSSAKACPNCGKAQTKASTKVIGGLFIVMVVLLVWGTMSDDPALPPPSAERAPSPHEAMRQNLALDYSSTRSDLNVLSADFSLTNNNDSAVADVAINCTTYSRSRTPLNHLSYTLYEIVRPGQTINFSGTLGFIDPQASEVNCRVVTAKW